MNVIDLFIDAVAEADAELRRGLAWWFERPLWLAAALLFVAGLAVGDA